MSEKPVTRYGLIRHAPTDWNEKKIIQGQLDSPLSAAGKIMAAAWGGQLQPFSWQRIICSDLGRARETASRINSHLGLPTLKEQRLREQDWGQWGGLSLMSIRQEHRQYLDKQVQAGWNFRPPGGESRRQVLQRSLAALNEIQETFPGEMILVVCHEGVIKCLVYHLLNRRFMPDEPKIIRNFHMHLLAAEPGIIYLEQLNRLPLSGVNDD